MKLKRILGVFTTAAMLLSAAFSVPAHADSDEISYKISYSRDYTFLELTPSDDDNIIRYTTDGSVPDEDSKLYENRLRTSKIITLRIAEFDENGEKVDTLKIKLRRKCVKVDIESEKTDDGYRISLSTDTKGADIYYTTDGSEPDEDSNEYSEAFTVKEGTVVRAIAVKKNWKDSNCAKKTIKAETAEAKTAEAEYGETELKILEIVNKRRKENGLEELVMDEALYEAAQIRAKELCKKYSHTRPDGTRWATVLGEVEFVYSFGGENIAYTEGSLSKPATVMKLWMESQGHKDNILNTSGSLIGVAAYKKGNTTYWVQLFGERK